MSTNVIPTEEEIDAKQFTSVRTPRALDEAALQQCADSIGSPDEGVPIFAIAAREGVVVNTETEHEYEAAAVLYATRDGEHVTEFHVAGGLAAAPRARVVESVDVLNEADDVARDYAREALAGHPELDDPEVSA